MAVTAGVALVGAGLGLYKSLKANSQGKKDAQEAERLKQPFYKVQDEYFQNRNAAAMQAGQGFSSDTKNFLATEGQRGLGTGISAVQQGGGGPNDVAKLLEGYQRSMGALGAEDAQMHQKNLEYFMGVNKDLAGQKTTQWTINEYQPYENKLKELTQRRAADKQNEQEGINTALGSLTAGATGMQNAALLKRLFATQKQAGMSDIADPYNAGWKNPVIAPTGAGATSPAAGTGYIDPNTPPGGIQTSPVYPGAIIN